MKDTKFTRKKVGHKSRELLFSKNLFFSNFVSFVLSW
jgi:hypothetical protein